ncbi:macrophage mannose receptor 1-like, partial [Orbicella faveolata]|uniref:macrophage mannose receptor 1-like n=1 Tax=Orbicella faveolata TaxID=48498 RepID=UPI0009E21E5B
TSVLDDKTPQLAEQTFNINNWGFGNIERKLLIDIKARIDSLFDKVTRPPCPEGWVLHAKSCFLIINIPTLERSDARRTCQNLGGDLAIIRSAEENNFIFGLVKQQDTITFYGVWLGFIRKSDSKFYWIDNTPLKGHYSPWGSGEPNNANNNEYCSSMFGKGGRAGKWNDLWCSLKESQLKDAPSILCQKKAN